MKKPTKTKGPWPPNLTDKDRKAITAYIKKQKAKMTWEEKMESKLLMIYFQMAEWYKEWQKEMDKRKNKKMKKKDKNKLTSFKELEERFYGKEGTKKREKYEQQFRDEMELLSPPGNTILETIQEKGITASELAEAMNIPQWQIDGIISGTLPITETDAIGLQQCLGIDKQFWINREKNYRDKLKWIEEQEKKKP